MGKAAARGKFYAVRVGVKPGVYRSWKECSANVTGFKGAQFKSFELEQDAQAYFQGKIDELKARLQARDSACVAAQDDEVETELEKHERHLSDYRTELERHVAAKSALVYTDGSTLNNGAADISLRRGALRACFSLMHCFSAGIGVFFGNGDKRNITAPFTLDPLTNQRAGAVLCAFVRVTLIELFAAIRALQVLTDEAESTPAVIITDSKYTINCAT
jgi:ribonuclease HI